MPQFLVRSCLAGALLLTACSSNTTPNMGRATTGALTSGPFSGAYRPMAKSLRLPPGGQRTVDGYAPLNNPRTLRCVPQGISLNALLNSMIQQESGGKILAVGYDWKPSKSIFLGASVGILQELELSKWIVDQGKYEQLRASAKYIPNANDYHAEGSLKTNSDTKDAYGNSTTVLTNEGVGIMLKNSNRLYYGVNRYVPGATGLPYNVYDFNSQVRVALGELYIDKGLLRNAYWAVVHYNGSGSFAESYAQEVLGRILPQDQINCLKANGH
jgi:hypothetical protein